MKSQISRAGTITVRQKHTFKADMKDLSVKLEEIQGLIQQYDANPAKFNLTNKQVAQRKQDYNSIAQTLKELED